MSKWAWVSSFSFWPFSPGLQIPAVVSFKLGCFEQGLSGLQSVSKSWILKKWIRVTVARDCNPSCGILHQCAMSDSWIQFPAWMLTTALRSLKVTATNKHPWADREMWILTLKLTPQHWHLSWRLLYAIYALEICIEMWDVLCEFVLFKFHIFCVIEFLLWNAICFFASTTQ